MWSGVPTPFASPRRRRGHGGAASADGPDAVSCARICVLVRGRSFLIDTRLSWCFIVRVDRHDHLNATAGALEQRMIEQVLQAVTEPLFRSYGLH